MSESGIKKEPFVSILSPKVKVLYGYKDGRAYVCVTYGVELPHQEVPPAKIPDVRKLFSRFYGWALKSEEERKGGKGDVEEVLDDRCKVRGEYPDGHVDLCVRVAKYVPLVKIEVPWIPIELSKEEVIQGKKTMDEVWGWLQLPEDVRNLQGV